MIGKQKTTSLQKSFFNASGRIWWKKVGVERFELSTSRTCSNIYKPPDFALKFLAFSTCMFYAPCVFYRPTCFFSLVGLLCAFQNSILQTKAQYAFIDTSRRGAAGCQLYSGVTANPDPDPDPKMKARHAIRHGGQGKQLARSKLSRSELLGRWLFLAAFFVAFGLFKLRRCHHCF